MIQRAVQRRLLVVIFPECGGADGSTLNTSTNRSPSGMQMLPERRAPNAELAGETPAGSTTRVSRFSPTGRGTASSTRQCWFKSSRDYHFEP